MTTVECECGQFKYTDADAVLARFALGQHKVHCDEWKRIEQLRAEEKLTYTGGGR